MPRKMVLWDDEFCPICGSDETIAITENEESNRANHDDEVICNGCGLDGRVVQGPLDQPHINWSSNNL